jgi:upstream activation factor subunit UAF30
MPRKTANKTADKSATKSATKPKTSKKSSTKSVSKLETTPPPTVVVEPTPAVETPPVEVAEKSSQELIDEQFQTLNEKLVAIRAMEVSLMAELKALHKNTLKHMKTMNKKKKRSTSDKKNRSPSGFAKPTKMSQELCKFLNKPEGTEMARTDVTKFITKYVKDNELQNPENRREIKCDNKLKALLNVDDQVPVTYFNLQKYMKVHFMKSESAVVV